MRRLIGEQTTRGPDVNLLDDLMPDLRRLLCEQVAAEPGARRIALPLVRAGAGGLLDWLAAQPVFPKFYWMHRDGSEEVAALGEVCRFEAAAQASAFVAAQAAPFRIWGGAAFAAAELPGHDGLGGWFFLPRFELRQGADGAELAINLLSERSLAEDARLACAQLDRLVAGKAVAMTDVQVVGAQHRPDKAHWCRLVQESLAAIADGQFDKVVLARKTTLTLDGPLSPAQLLGASRQLNHRCFHFMLAHDAEHGCVGSSPERLFSRHGLSLHTEALAGTAPCTGDAAQDRKLAQWLLADAKNRTENALVADDICARLAGKVDAVTVCAAEVLALRKVQHLRRRIAAHLRRVDDAECLAWLHATAAVAGVPREAAREFIRAREPFSRGWYAGSVGYISRSRAEFTVAIRYAEVQRHKVHLFAGAGLVPGSDAEAEWQEIGRKAAGLRTLLEPDLVVECV